MTTSEVDQPPFVFVLLTIQPTFTPSVFVRALTSQVCVAIETHPSLL